MTLFYCLDSSGQVSVCNLVLFHPPCGFVLHQECFRSGASYLPVFIDLLGLCLCHHSFFIFHASKMVE